MTSNRRPPARRDDFPAAVAAVRPVARWREQLDSFGGPVVIGVIALLVVGLVAMAVNARPTSISEAPLLGDAVLAATASHITDPARLAIPDGEPPAGGPHFPVPQPAGLYDASLADGNVIHSLEHGMVWISYREDLLGPGELELLKKVARAYRADILLSPRPANSQRVAVVSWERRMRVASPLREKDLRAFIETNRNRSPEPNVR